MGIRVEACPEVTVTRALALPTNGVRALCHPVSAPAPALSAVRFYGALFSRSAGTEAALKDRAMRLNVSVQLLQPSTGGNIMSEMAEGEGPRASFKFYM